MVDASLEECLSPYPKGAFGGTQHRRTTDEDSGGSTSEGFSEDYLRTEDYVRRLPSGLLRRECVDSGFYRRRPATPRVRARGAHNL
jgi:hypothetical protein